MKNKLIFLVIVLLVFAGHVEKTEANVQRLKISNNGRSLIKEDGTPFFWLGDTAWSLPTVSPEEVDLYLNDRAQRDSMLSKSMLILMALPIMPDCARFKMKTRAQPQIRMIGLIPAGGNILII